MKTKPNVSQFTPDKNPDAFLEGATAELKANAAPVQQSARVQREQKVFRLPTDVINALKREALERSINSGGRVTETDLVEQALRAFLNI